jgi:hypothetical protein
MTIINPQTIPFGRSINRFVRGAAQDAIQVLGRSLPASVVKIVGAIVQVNFELTGTQTIPQATVPTLGSQYVRVPIQPGEKGVTIAADTYLGGMSGLGGGVADGTIRGNLTPLVWSPIGNTGWDSVDPNQLTLTGGPNGILAKAAAGSSSLTITSTAITLAVGGHSVVINGSGVTIDGVAFLPHVHSGVSTGSGDTGPVVP